MMRGFYLVWYDEKIVPGLVGSEGCTGSGRMRGFYLVWYDEKVVSGLV